MTPYDMIKAHLTASVPFAAHTGVVIEAIGPGTARTTLAARTETSNHVGTPHAGAVFTLGETASGAALAGAFADILLSLRPVAAEAQIGFLRLATGSLTAEAKTGLPPTDLRATLDSEGKVVFPVNVTITDETGAEVSRMSVHWHVSRTRS